MGGEVPETGRKVVAAFDFDGTLTTCDTLPLFIRFVSSTLSLLTGTLKMVPTLFLFKLKFIPNYKAKERLFKIFFKGIDINTFNRLSEKFIQKIDEKINVKAIEKLKWHQSMGHEVVIVSASVENWIRPWANKYGIESVLATELQLDNQLITGNFLNENCHGAVKVARLIEQYPDREQYLLYAYGDSNGDKELLAFADYAFYRSF